MVCSPIFIVYLVFLLSLLFFKDGRLKAIIIYVTFIFFFEASSFGADYGVYQRYYSMNNYTWQDIEILYVEIATLCSSSGMSFGVFRFLWGSAWVGVICYCLFKMNRKYFNLSFLVLYLGYPVYTLSAFRQLATMALGFWCVYRMFFKRDFIMPVIASYVSAMFHKSGYVYFAFCLASAVAALIGYIYSKISHKPNPFAAPSRLFSKFCKYGWFIFPVLCLIGRAVVYALSYVSFVKELILSVVGASYFSRTLLTVGILSRMVLLILVMWMYPHIDKKSDVGPIVLFYVICMAAYIVLPMETFAGRLFNNGRILEVVLIPIIYSRLRSYERSERKFVRAYGETYVFPVAKTYLVLSLAVYFVMFYQQMCTLGAYTTYTNIFPFLSFS